MVQSLENIDKSKVSATRIEGLNDIIETEIGNTLTGAVSTITTSDLIADKVLISNSNGKVATSNVGIDDLQMTAGDWIDITNSEISAKGDTSIYLGESETVTQILYAWQSNDTNILTIYTESLDVAYPCYTSEHHKIKENVSLFGGEDTQNYYFQSATIDTDLMKILVTKETTVFGGDTTTETIEYVRDSTLDTSYGEEIVITSSDEVLPTQSAVKTYVDAKNSFTYNNNTQMMIIGDTE